MTLRRLKLYALLGLALLVALIEASRYSFARMDTPAGGLYFAYVLVILGAVAFFSVLFRYFQRLQDELVRRNRELLTLHTAAQDVHRVLDLDLLLQRVVDEARELVGARFGALTVVGDDGAIRVFHTSGVSVEERARIGAPPRGHGLLGVTIHEGQILRLPEIGDDPRSVGFPANHPPMKSLLAVPVECRGPFRGNLYLSDRVDRREFSEEDAETLQRFATQVGIAIDNQFLNRRLRELAVAEERSRISRDLHDGTAQVLAYVNTKAQAAREYLASDRRDEAIQQLDQLATAAREVYAEVRRGIVTLRDAARQERSFAEGLRALAEHWQDEVGVTVEHQLDPEVRIEPEAEIQLLRIASEALTNARKHARASRVVLVLETAREGIRLSVEDDGCGFDPAEPRQGERPGFGLHTMRERAESIGGTLRVESRPGGPTRMVAELPERRASHGTKGDPT